MEKNINRLTLLLLIVAVGMQTALLVRSYVGDRTTASTTEQLVHDAPQGATMQIADLPVQGNRDAVVMLVEFTDYECPFCARHATTVAKELDKKYVISGKVKHVVVNNPLPIHSNARLLAAGAICAREQGVFWPMHDRIFSERPRTERDLLSLFGGLSRDNTGFENCLMEDSRIGVILERDVAKAQEFGLIGTPSFAIGKVDSVGVLSIKKFIKGAAPITVFEDVLNPLVNNP